jgi:serine/threonine protein kinase
MHAELVIEFGEPLGRQFVLREGQRFEIGRSGVAVVLEQDAAVSRKHAQIELKPDGQVLLTDLNSRNGTRLRGQPLEPYRPEPVEQGDAIRIGDHVLTVSLAEPDLETRRVRRDVLPSDEEVLLEEEFEILGIIGVGAHGRVYAARQRVIDRRVALKFLHPTKSEDRETIERFTREGRLACRVRSPYVVQVLDFRVEGRRVYLVMELIDGISLADRLRGGGAIPIPEALSIGAEVARGLAVVHLEGVIHRDIKPSNILLAPSGVAKLGDFGIAKDLLDSEPLTPRDEGLGSLPYVSPEQAVQAAQVHTGTDVYSLGATIYRMLAGRTPYSDLRGNRLDLILHQPPTPLRELNPECPPAVCDLVHSMLAKAPEDRPSAEAVALCLETLRAQLYPAYSSATHRQRVARVTQTGQHTAISDEDERTEVNPRLDGPSPTPRQPPTRKMLRDELAPT